MRSTCLALLFVVTACGPDQPPPPPEHFTPAQQAEVRGLLDRARGEAQTHEDAVARAARAAAAAFDPSASGERCAVHVSALDELEPLIDPLALSSTHIVAARGNSRFLGPEGATLHDLPGPAMQSIEDLEFWRTNVERPVYGRVADELARLRTAIRVTLPEHEIVVVASELESPHVIDEDTFAPGRLHGVVLLLDRDQRVVCSAPVDVTSGESVRAHSAAEGAVLMDLVARAVITGYRALRSTSPR